MNAGDIMTVGAATVRPDDTVGEAARMMLQYQISGLPVVDDNGRLVGIVSETDFLRRSELGTERRSNWLELLVGSGPQAEAYIRSHGQKVSDVMTRDVVTVRPDAPVREIVELMERHGIKRLPVVEGPKVVGMVSRANLIRILARLAESAPPPPANDRQIQSRLRNEIDRLDWAPRAALNIRVENGIVHLWGTIFDERERHALKVAAESIPGVKGVEDHLVLPTTQGWV